MAPTETFLYYYRQTIQVAVIIRERGFDKSRKGFLGKGSLLIWKTYFQSLTRRIYSILATNILTTSAYFNEFI